MGDAACKLSEPQAPQASSPATAGAELPRTASAISAELRPFIDAMARLLVADLRRHPSRP